MKITENEIKKVSAIDDFKRYKYSLKRIADHTNVYTLKSNNGDWAVSAVGNNNLFPIWPAVEYAIICAIGAWSGFVVQEISLNAFQKELMTVIEAEGFLLNVFPVGNTTGFVVDLEEFTRDIKEELRKYE